jgi:large subunit ribosomal protein L9
MATELILMADIPTLGVEGDVVHVADGYARNYLLPRKLAAPVSVATRRKLVKLQAERKERDRVARGAAQILAERLAKVSCTIPVKTIEGDKLYGSVTSADIAKTLAELGVPIDRHLIDLEQPIKELGCFDVAVKLHPEVRSTVKVWVVEE